HPRVSRAFLARAIHLGVILSILGAGCERQPARDAGAPARASEAGIPGTTPAGAVDPGRLRPGDRWLGLRVETLQLRPETVDPSGWSGSVRLSGRLRLSGEYRPHPSYPEVREVCFYPDSSSAERLPRFPNDVRT